MIEDIRTEIETKVAAAKAKNKARLLNAAQLEEAVARYQAEMEAATTAEEYASAQSRKQFASKQLELVNAEAKALAYPTKEEAVAERKRLYAAWASEAKPIYEEMQGIVNSLSDCYNKLVAVSKNGDDVLTLLGHQRPFGEYVYPLHGHPLMIPRNLHQLASGNEYAAEISTMIDKCGQGSRWK